MGVLRKQQWQLVTAEELLGKETEKINIPELAQDSISERQKSLQQQLRQGSASTEKELA